MAGLSHTMEHAEYCHFTHRPVCGKDTIILYYTVQHSVWREAPRKEKKSLRRWTSQREPLSKEAAPDYCFQSSNPKGMQQPHATSMCFTYRLVAAAHICDLQVKFELTARSCCVHYS